MISELRWVGFWSHKPLRRLSQIRGLHRNLWFACAIYRRRHVWFLRC